MDTHAFFKIQNLKVGYGLINYSLMHKIHEFTDYFRKQWVKCVSMNGVFIIEVQVQFAYLRRNNGKVLESYEPKKVFEI